MAEIARLLARQTEWQRSLRDLPWPEKVRMAARLRDQILALRRTGPPDPAKHRRP